jgi:transposase-like protein
MPTTPRTLTAELKAEAVELVTGQGRSSVEAARDLDRGESTPRSGPQAIAKGDARPFPGRGNPPALEGGPRRLRADVKRLATGRDILEKAPAFFAGESS